MTGPPRLPRLVLCAVLAAGVLGGALAGGIAGAVAGAASARGHAPALHPKRGVASARELVADPAALSRLGAAWAYNWSATPPRRGGGPEWVPMVWGSGTVTPSTIATLTAARRAGRARFLLGFNEPDSGSQANMTPAQAANLWPALERTGLRLGSPAPAVPTDGWLARFMALARLRHLRVDFLALHYYQDFTDPNAVASLRRQLIAIHAQFGKPIWITEIGAMDIRRWHEPMLRPPSATAAAHYVRRLFAMLDGLRFVQRYAWFTDQCTSDSACRFSSLLSPRGLPTATGTAYRSAR